MTQFVDRETFLRTWFNEVNKFVPPEIGDTYQNFISSPIVKSCLLALEMNSPNYAQAFTLLETNLETCLELKTLPQIPRTIIVDALRQVQQMKKVAT